jgi:hypothetical protein
MTRTSSRVPIGSIWALGALSVNFHGSGGRGDQVRNALRRRRVTMSSSRSVGRIHFTDEKLAALMHLLSRRTAEETALFS